MANFLIISAEKDEGYRALELFVKPELDAEVRFHPFLSEEELSRTDLDCAIFMDAISEHKLRLAKNAFINLRELSQIVGAEAERRMALEDFNRKLMEGAFEPLKVRVEQGEDIEDADWQEILGALFNLLSFLSKVVKLGNEVKLGLLKIANEGEIPPALLLASEEEGLLTYQESLDAKELAKFLQPLERREKAKPKKVLPLRSLEDAFLRLKEGKLEKLGFEYRKEQEEFAYKVEEAFSTKTHLIIEAGTGVGKSIGYLLPAILHSIESEERVVISTYTKILQEQLIKSDFPMLSHLLEEELPAPVVLKGRENYLCLEKMRLRVFGDVDELRQFFGEIKERAKVAGRGRKANRILALTLIRLSLSVLEEAEDKLINGARGDFERIQLDMAEDENIGEAIREKLSCAFRGCLKERCPLFRECFFYCQRDLAEKARLTVLNHALLFSLYHPLSEPEDFLASFVDKSLYFVLDEAHNLEEAILSALSSKISSFELIDFANSLLRLMENKALINRLSIPEDKLNDEEKQVRQSLSETRRIIPSYAEEIFSIFEEIKEIAEKLYLNFRDREEEIFQFEIINYEDDAKRRLKEEILEIVEKLDEILSQLSLLLHVFAEKTGRAEGASVFEIDDNRYQIALRETVNHLAELKEASKKLLTESNEIARWMEVRLLGDAEGYFFNLCASPVTVGKAFADFLSSKDCVVMVSGTIAVRNSFEFFKRSLGIEQMERENLMEVRLQSPFDYEERALVLIPADTPAPDFYDKKEHRNYLEALAQAVVFSANAFHGRTLVLFNSYSDLNKVAEMCEEKLVELGLKPLLQTRTSSRTRLAEQFKRLEGAVLLGTRSFWEGFDVKGERLECVIISKLPFPNVKDPMVAGRARLLEAQGRSSFNEFMLPYAILKFVQGFGRLIRSKTDFGSVIVMDRRILSKNYGASFIESLPKTRVETVSLEETPRRLRRFLDSVRGQS